MNRIVIELSEVDRALLEGVRRELEISNKGGHPLTVEESGEAAAEPITEEKEEPKEEVKEPEKVAEKEQAAPESTPAEPVQQHTKADLQKRVVELCAAGQERKDAVKKIINEYAEKVSAVPEDKIDEVMNRLNKLEG